MCYSSWELLEVTKILLVSCSLETRPLLTLKPLDIRDRPSSGQLQLIIHCQLTVTSNFINYQIKLLNLYFSLGVHTTIPNATSFCTTHLFADGMKLLKPISSINESTLMQQDLDSLASWCSTWKLSLNTSKCAALRFSLSSSPPNTYMYSINNHPIKFVDSHKLRRLFTQNSSVEFFTWTCQNVQSWDCPHHWRN